MASTSTITRVRPGTAMENGHKTTAQLITELEALRQEVASRAQGEPDGDLSVTLTILESVLEQAPLPMAIATVDGKLFSFNRACAEALGCADDPEIRPGVSLSEIERSWRHFDPAGNSVPSDQLPLVLAVRGEETHNRELGVVRKDGTRRVHCVDAVPIHDDGGALVAGLVTFHDITDQKRSEAALRENEAKFHSIFVNSRDAIGVARNGLHTLVNPAYVRMFGYDEEQELIGKPSTLCIPPSERRAVETIEARARGEDVETVYQTRGLRKDGSQFDLHVTVSGYTLNNVTYTLAILRDITESKRAERSIKALVEATASFTGADYFPSMVRHLAAALQVQHAIVARCVGDGGSRVRSLAFWSGNDFCEPFEYDVKNTPCQRVTEEGCAVYYSSGVQERFPNDSDLARLGADSYLGVPILGSTGAVIGHVVLLDRTRIDNTPETQSILRIFATRAGAELERMDAERALAESEEKFRTLTVSSPVGMFLQNAEGKGIYVNARCAELVGLTGEEALSLDIRSVHSDDREEVKTRWVDAVTNGTEFHGDCRWVHGDGTVVWTHGDMVPARGGDGKVKLFIGTLADITAQKHAEQLQVAHNHVLKLLASGEASQGEILKTIARIAEAHASDVRGSILLLEGNKIRNGAAPSMPDAYNALLDGLDIGPVVGSCGTAMYRGERVVVEDVRTDPLWADFRSLGEEYGFRACWSEPFFDSDGNVLGTFALYHAQPGRPSSVEIELIESMASLARITIERKRREGELKKLTAAVDQSPALIVITDPDGAIEYVNPIFCKISGYSAEEVVGMNLNIIDSGETAVSTYTEIIKGVFAGEPWKGELLNRKKDGTEFWLTGTISPITDDAGTVSHLLSVQKDITQSRFLEEEKRELEKQLLHSQKMETIGTLAGGIAHDFNNILTPIMGYSEMAYERTDVADPLRSDLGQILNAARRARELVERILVFSRHQVEKKHAPAKMQLIAEEAIHLLRPSIPTTIAIRTQIDHSCSFVLADESQIHQVVVNLCTNAFQAMEGTHGTLTVAVTQVRMEEALKRTHPQLAQSEYVQLTVSDTGTGMDEATVERIFEPFFTTKPAGRGTGMGLSVVHGIVQSHGGEILVHSNPGEGTTFDLYFPVTTLGAAAPPGTAADIPGGNESVLVVDDDPAVAEVVVMMLKRLGYETTKCTTSGDAIEKLKQRPGTFALILSDLTMPHGTGLELAERASEIQPGIPTVIMTGYGENIGRDTRGGQQHVASVLAKPIVIKNLAKVIRETLDGTG